MYFSPPWPTNKILDHVQFPNFQWSDIFSWHLILTIRYYSMPWPQFSQSSWRMFLLRGHCFVLDLKLNKLRILSLYRIHDLELNKLCILSLYRIHLLRKVLCICHSLHQMFLILGWRGKGLRRKGLIPYL